MRKSYAVRSLIFAAGLDNKLVSPVIWSTSSSAPAVVNGQNTVTNPVSRLPKFYR
jgi:hypothetical protein